MSLLLDTHALLWWLADDPELGQQARVAIAEAETLVYVSSVSVWEIAIKRKLGKLVAPEDLLAELERQRFVQLPLSAAEAWMAGHLDVHHTDPFDRAMVAQSLVHGLRVVTRDSSFAEYGVDVLRT